MGSSKSSSTSSWKPNSYQKQILQNLVDTYNGTYLPTATSLADISNSQRDGLASQTLDYNSMLDSANSQISSAQQGLADLTTSGLPSEYLQQITNSLSSVSDNLIGGSVNNLVAKGIMSSSQGNKVLSDNSQNINNLVNQQYSNYMNQLSNLYNNQIQNAGAQIGLAGTTQNQAQQAASNSLTDSLNAYNAASGILGTGGTTTQSSSGGGNQYLQAALGVASIFCFTGDTKVYTENGDKDIKDIKVGDKVGGCDDYGRVCYQTVTDVQEPVEEEVWEIVAADNNKLYKVKTTLSQPFLTEKGDYVPLSLMKLKTRLARVGEVIEFRKLGKEKVYDLKVAPYNNYFANDFVAFGIVEG